jgi:mRNA-degrading endonuclease toxin of MazEF toxin-antitoxin module
MRQAGVANADDITTVPKRWIDRYITVLSPGKSEALEAAIKFALDLR